MREVREEIVEEEEQGERELKPETHPDFLDEKGNVDQDKYLEYLDREEGIQSEEPDNAEGTLEESLMVDFILQMCNQAAQIGQYEYDQWPTDVDGNSNGAAFRQPWFRIRLYRAYWQGEGEAWDEEMDEG